MGYIPPPPPPCLRKEGVLYRPTNTPHFLSGKINIYKIKIPSQNDVNPMKSGGGGGHNVSPTINNVLFVTPRVFVRFLPNLVTFPIILLEII